MIKEGLSLRKTTKRITYILRSETLQVRGLGVRNRGSRPSNLPGNLGPTLAGPRRRWRAAAASELALDEPFSLSDSLSLSLELSEYVYLSFHYMFLDVHCSLFNRYACTIRT